MYNTNKLSFSTKYPRKFCALHERHLFGYYSLWLVVYRARMDIVLPACCTFQHPVALIVQYVLTKSYYISGRLTMTSRQGWANML